MAGEWVLLIPIVAWAIDSLNSRDTASYREGDENELFTNNTTIYFNGDRSGLDPDDKAKLDKNIEWLQGIDIATKIIIKIDGYTCDTPGLMSNSELAQNRADEVKSYLENKGKELKLKLISSNRGANSGSNADLRKAVITYPDYVKESIINYIENN